MNDLPHILLPSFIPSPEAVEERNRILSSRYFLVKIAGNGDVWRCKRCHAKHRYLTLMCIEQPFNGLSGGLYAYWKTVKDEGLLSAMTPAQRARFERLSATFGNQPNLVESHPETVRSMGMSERDLEVGAYALGILEPITEQKAKQLAAAINRRGIKPQFVIGERYGIQVSRPIRRLHL